MAGSKLTVVISQSQGKNPAKRHLEEELAAALMMDSSISVSIVPHLYDLTPDHTGILFLRSVPGDVVVLGWLYPRAMRWTLDRAGVKGQEGVTLIPSADEDEDPDDEAASEAGDEPQGIGALDVPKRRIYCIDLRDHSEPGIYLDEIRRISREQSVQTVDLMGWINGSPKPQQLERYLQPDAAPPASNGNGGFKLPLLGGGDAPADETGEDEAVRRRWYPVIDYDRCTNCMECIDFCLFGVYGVDQQERILVELQDNCKKGCPACSRVCPENAIIFPGHKAPGIAGAEGEVAGLKIDLTKLFGGGASALEIAAQERDVELVRDGREAVGLTVGIPKRQSTQADQPRDDLDDLMDSLDNLDL